MRLSLPACASVILTWSSLGAQELPHQRAALRHLPLAGPNTLPSRGTCFRGRPQLECRAFFVTEWGWALRFGDQTRQYGHNSYWTWQLGWMRNVGARTALGASLFLGAETDRFDQSGLTLGVKARYRHWLKPKVALEVGAGPAFGGWLITHASVAYGDWVALEVQAEPGQKVYGERSFATYAGVRFGSYPGTVLGIAAPLAALITLAASYHAD